MRKIQCTLSLFLLPFIFMNIAFAQASESLVEKNSLFIRTGYCHAAETKLQGRGVFSAGGTLFISKKVGLEFEGRANLMDSVYDTQLGLQAIGEGNLTLMGINFSIFYTTSLSKRFGLYLLAGTGYSFNNFSLHEEYDTLGFRIEESLDRSISFHIGTGLDIAVFSKIALNLDIRYTLSEAGGNWSVEDTLGTALVSGTTKTNLNALTVMLGIRFLL